MIPLLQDSKLVLDNAISAGLYQQLMLQLQKDFQLSGLSLELATDLEPEGLLKQLFSEIQRLMEHNFDAYLQLLYRVDIPEQAMQTSQAHSIAELSKRATLQILQREWQKVYFRNTY